MVSCKQRCHRKQKINAVKTQLPFAPARQAAQDCLHWLMYAFFVVGGGLQFPHPSSWYLSRELMQNKKKKLAFIFVQNEPSKCLNAIRSQADRKNEQQYIEEQREKDVPTSMIPLFHPLH